jgi:hypothetical protein
MKRSSSVAALADPEGETKWNWQDDMLATSMRLVAIEEEDSHRNSMKRNHQNNGSMGSMASSRCSSGGSLQGWGTTASRKSYKRDLSSLASLDDHGAPSCSSREQHPSSKDTPPYPPTLVAVNTSGVCKDYSSSGASSADGADSWGFFVDSAF